MEGRMVAMFGGTNGGYSSMNVSRKTLVTRHISDHFLGERRYGTLRATGVEM